MHLEDMVDWTLEKCRKVEDIPASAEGPVFEHMRLRSSADTYEKENARKYDLIRREHREFVMAVEHDVKVFLQR